MRTACVIAFFAVGVLLPAFGVQDPQDPQDPYQDQDQLAKRLSEGLGADVRIIDGLEPPSAYSVRAIAKVTNLAPEELDGFRFYSVGFTPRGTRVSRRMALCLAPLDAPEIGSQVLTLARNSHRLV